jgi:hypothetical protein
MNALSKHTPAPLDSAIIASVVLNGDLAKLSPQQKILYYNSLCERIGLDPATTPFQLLNLKGKEILYAGKGAAQQLNRMYKISHEVLKTELIDDVYMVTCKASTADRSDVDFGAVAISGKKGEELANLIMKAATKSKRRATLSLCGLSMMDETELDTLPDATALPLPKLPHSAIVEKHEVISAANSAEINAEPIQQAEVLPPSLSEKEKAGKYAFPFGIHKGKTIEMLTDVQLKRTLEWCKSNNKYPDTQKAITEYLETGDLPF